MVWQGHSDGPPEPPRGHDDPWIGSTSATKPFNYGPYHRRARLEQFWYRWRNWFAVFGGVCVGVVLIALFIYPGYAVRNDAVGPVNFSQLCQQQHDTTVFHVGTPQGPGAAFSLWCGYGPHTQGNEMNVAEYCDQYGLTATFVMDDARSWRCVPRASSSGFPVVGGSSWL